MTLEIGAAPLTPQSLAAAARDGCSVRLHPAAWARIAAGHQALDRLTAAGGAIYGVTTGLGAVADTRIAPVADSLQRRVVLARMVGVGPSAAPEQVRAVMLARLAGFAEGRSGVSPSIVEAYLARLNSGVLPVMPLVGSVGEADLAPLAHIAGVLAADPTVAFGAKDGLALVSSNAAATGLAALLVADTERLFGAWLAAAVLSFEGFRANLAPLHPRAAMIRPAPGQAEVAAALMAMFEGGALTHPEAARKLQDPLSFRCVPPVLGACLAAFRAATAAVTLELNSSDDNPAILAADLLVQPNANFDPTHLVLAFETLGLAFARVAAAQGWRILKLMSPDASGLPRFLSPIQEGRSGFAAVQKTVASLMAEIGQNAMPMPALILPAADGVEDYGTMAVSVMRRVAAMLEQMRLLCAIELLVAAQACDLREAPNLGLGAAEARVAVRATVDALADDRPSAPDIRALDQLIESGCFDRFAKSLTASA